MRWSNFFEGFDSLWDGEDDGAERDERRELVRADRATQTFRDVVIAHGGEHSLTTSVAEIDGFIHVNRLGANWIDGVICLTRDRIIIPLPKLTAVSTGTRCECEPKRLSVFNHVTLGAVLRELERQQATVSLLHAGGGYNGLITAVWKDALSIRSGVVTVTVQMASLICLIVRRS